MELLYHDNETELFGETGFLFSFLSRSFQSCSLLSSPDFLNGQSFSFILLMWNRSDFTDLLCLVQTGSTQRLLWILFARIDKEPNYISSYEDVSLFVGGQGKAEEPLKWLEYGSHQKNQLFLKKTESRKQLGFCLFFPSRRKPSE